MATLTFLSNATVNVTPATGSSADLSDQCSSVVLESKKVALRKTAMGDAAEYYTAGLQDNTLTLNLYNSYGNGEVEEVLNRCLGTATTIVVSPSGTTEAPDNPEYTLTGAYLESVTPINSVVGELSAVSAVFRGGVLTRDIVFP